MKMSFNSTLAFIIEPLIYLITDQVTNVFNEALGPYMLEEIIKIGNDGLSSIWEWTDNPAQRVHTD